MEYLKGQAFLGDFAQRTFSNLKVIEQASKDGNEAYEVTQLVNSLLALIVFPKERCYITSNKGKWKKYLSKYVIYPNKNITYDNIMKNLRNAISHSHILFEKDNYLDKNGKARINAITFVSCKFIDNKPQCPEEVDCEKCKLNNGCNDKPDFQMTIPIKELHQFIEFFAADIANVSKASMINTEVVKNDQEIN